MYQIKFLSIFCPLWMILSAFSTSVYSEDKLTTFQDITVTGETRDSENFPEYIIFKVTTKSGKNESVFVERNDRDAIHNMREKRKNPEGCQLDIKCKKHSNDFNWIVVDYDNTNCFEPTQAFY